MGWGAPIVMKAGKALDVGKVEIRIQFKPVASGMFSQIPNNEFSQLESNLMKLST